ncbi:hypothetical protein INR49_005581 [Caranx melampygus]|nr:hypothetical protein INR49_005581 [Caranx melampygus]
MDPLLPADTEVMEREEDKDARRKIQFSVPSSVPTQLDPRQVEMVTIQVQSAPFLQDGLVVEEEEEEEEEEDEEIRRRRPTPATLFRLTDPPSPDEDSGPHQWVLGENGALKAKLVHASTYQPPSLKAVQKMAQAHLASLDKEDPLSAEEDEEGEKNTVSATDLRGEGRPIRDQYTPSDISKVRVDLSHHHGDEEEDAKEREDGKGE